MLGVIYVVDSDAKGDWREHEIIEEEYEIEVEGKFKPFGVTDET